MNGTTPAPNKHDRMETFIAGLGADPASAQHRCLQGYCRLFDQGQYYEAHDVLEHLWLATPRSNPDYDFYKGLIQLAGAFVHLQKQFYAPDHPKHGRRLAPAARLFAIAADNLAPAGPQRHGLDVSALRQLCEERSQLLAASGFTRNPRDPTRLPSLRPRERTSSVS